MSDESRGPNWFLVGGVAAAVVVGGLAAYLQAPTEPAPVFTPRPLFKVVAPTPRPLPVVVPEPAHSQDAGSPDVARHDPECETPPFVGRGVLTVGFDSNGWPMYIPKRATERRKLPLLLLLHAAGESGREFLDYSGFEKLADERGFMIIAPDGALLKPWEQSLEPVLAALEEAKHQLCVDETRIYAVGHGSGGYAVEQLQCETSLTAIAVSAHRNPPHGLCDLAAPVPYIHLAGLQDKYNPVKGGESCTGSERISLADKEKFWRKRHGCSGNAIDYRKHATSQCMTWKCQQPFISCHLDGGRGWPGAAPRAFDMMNCDGEPPDFPYATVIWEFFAKVSAY